MTRLRLTTLANIGEENDLDEERILKLRNTEQELAGLQEIVSRIPPDNIVILDRNQRP